MTSERPRITASSAPPDVVLELQAVTKYFASGGPLSLFGSNRPPIRAVDGVSFAVRRGRNFGLVGESGSGKTTIGKLVLGLERPTAGRILFEGDDVARLSRSARKAFRQATHVVFQDPNSSLSPRMRIRDIVGEPLIPLGMNRSARSTRVPEVLELVGLPAAAGQRFPHEFSGGQRQRIAIARAIVAKPRLVVLDEPVSALDVSIRAQILNLLRNLQERLSLTYLMVAHDLSVVYHACDDIAVMYLGRFAELAPADELFSRPLHPYTRILLSSIPQPDRDLRTRERLPLSGEIPSPTNPPSGCRFHTRCPIAIDQCRIVEPEWREASPGHWVACHLAEAVQ